MAFILSASILIINNSNKVENIQRKRLRDASNPINIPENRFKEYFRLNKEGFSWILKKIESDIESKSIPLIIELAATLRLPAEGSFQRSVGNDSIVAMHRTTFSKSFSKMVVVLERRLCEYWIQISADADDILKCKQYFFEKFKIPGVIGCIDGTHVRIIKPGDQDFLYYNRKGYYSINAMIICDHKMNIMAIDATRSGSSHDSFIWNLSVARDFYLGNFENGDCGSWLLADSGYALEPFVLVPYRLPSAESAQHKFNKAHTSARNIIERTIGVLKSRFRWLSGALWYKPQKIVKIINICCALHNMCNFYKLEHNFKITSTPFEESEPGDAEINSNNVENVHASRNRDAIAESLFLNSFL